MTFHHPRHRKIYVLALLVFLTSNCANYREYIQKERRDWPAAQPDPSLKIEHRLFLVGDAGYAPEADTLPALRLLRQKLAEADENSSVVFLGDNLYPDGMAPRLVEQERALDEYRLTAQLEAVKDFPGQVFFIAGNHDWYGYGVDGLKREKKFIEKYLDQKEDSWEPDCGCSGPKEVELSENLVLLLVDSQWYLQDWRGEPKINDGCEVKSRSTFNIAFEEAVKGNRNKNIVIAVHHPPYSYGPHGGRFTWRQHFFPLTAVNKNWYLPLPVLGSAFAFLRGAVGSDQDMAHPEYRALRETMISAARKNGRFIFASGHEHSLQYIERDEQYFVVSGSGSKRSATGKGEGLQFAYGQHGLVQLDCYDDGSVWASYWVAEGETGRLAFRTQVKGPLPKFEETIDYNYTLYESDQDTVRRQLVERDFSKSRFGEWIWGEHYREAYNVTVPMPLLDLAEYQGGVRPVKRGGGYQTNSLRLEGEDERQYNMRSIAKDATRVLPYPLNESFALGVVEDNFSSAHPLAALAIPPLAKRIGIYYPEPKLYFTPAQPRLGAYNEAFAGAPYQVEERPDDEVWGGVEQFGGSDDIVSTLDMLENILDEHDHIVDQSFVVRNRIFDLLIGDWDRHDDQWRWATIEKDGINYYRPIPRDRDQAFSKYDGLLLSIFRNSAPAARPLRPYQPYVRRIQWSNFGSRFFDGTFLTDEEWPVWEEHARDIQRLLTDEVIESAFRNNWPEVIYDLNGPEIIGIMKQRRDNLVRLARQFYEVRARKVEVLGTHEKDLFDVERLPNGDTRVRVYDTNDRGDKEALFFDRLFHPDETREINLYGLDDDDIFQIAGRAGRGIRVRAIGGLGEDVFADESLVAGWGKKTEFYDFNGEERQLAAGRETRLRFTNDPVKNTYDRKAPHNNYNWGILIPVVSFNPDDGLLAGFLGQRTIHGFMKAPYASRHSFAGSFAFATSGLAARYTGEFVDVFGKWEFTLNARAQSERYSVNFYGFGNETSNPEDSLGRDYNRVRQGLIDLFPAITRRFNAVSTWSVGPTFESIRIDDTPGRFIDVIADQFDPQVFEHLEFAGVKMAFNYRNVDDPTFPTRGLGFRFDLGWKQQLQDRSQDFAYLNTDLSLYRSLDKANRVVLATRIGLRHNFSATGWTFYQGATLGGQGPRSNFRGFRRDRFTGQTAFFHNNDLRLQLLNSNNRVLPFKMGILAGFDHGRVWLDDEDSNVWHYSYGGGIFVSPLDLITMHFSLFRGDDAFNRFTFGGSFFF